MDEENKVVEQDVEGEGIPEFLRRKPGPSEDKEPEAEEPKKDNT